LSADGSTVAIGATENNGGGTSSGLVRVFKFDPYSHGDGISDTLDDFPNDSTETADTDADGVGDNADAFLGDPTETTDTDGDGTGDNAYTDDDGGGSWIYIQFASNPDTGEF